MDFGDNESDQIDTFHHFSSLLDETNDSVITDSEVIKLKFTMKLVSPWISTKTIVGFMS